MRFTFIILLLIGIYSILYSQHRFDNVWPMCYQQYTDLGNDTISLPEDVKRAFRHFNFTFSEDGPKLIHTPARKLPMHGTISIYCDSEGKLMYFTNGMSLCDSTLEKVPGAEQIGKNNLEYWDVSVGSSEWPWGYIAPQGTLILPWPEKDSIIILNSIQYFDLLSSKVSVCTIDKSKNNFHSIDQILSDSEYKWGRISSVKHGNGRDWWLMIPRFTGNEYDVYLFNSEGINLVHSYKFGTKHKGYDWGWSSFSPDGTKYADLDVLYQEPNRTRLSFFDFDRCSGILSNYQTDTIENYLQYFGSGLCFSPSGRYLYTDNAYNMYQYDMSSSNIKSTKKIIAEYDGFINSEGWNVPTTFGVMAPGPDGRIYNFTDQSSSNWMHVMHFPDEGGEDVKFVQHEIFTPYQGNA